MKKVFRYLRNNGIIKTINLLCYFINRKYHEYIIFKYNNNRKIFNSIYKNNYWGSLDSISGPGSTLNYTHNIRNQLPLIFNKFKIQILFDAPCGDFNWMNEVIKNNNIFYIGADIVDEIIKKNKIIYNTQNITFKLIDLTEDNFPIADLWICRDCLFHLSYSDILKTLNNYLKSEIPYLLTTTHKDKNIKNKDILTGDFRLINLYNSPFNFPDNCLYRFDDFLYPEPEREMCLWSKDQIYNIINNYANTIV